MVNLLLRSRLTKLVAMTLIIVIAAYFLWLPIQVAWLLCREPSPLPANTRMLSCLVHARTPHRMAQAGFSQAKLAQLRFYLDYSVYAEGDDRNIDAAVTLIALKDAKALVRMRNIVKWNMNSPISWVCAWGVFCMEGQDCVPFLLDCLDTNRRRTAEVCFRRLSFMDDEEAGISVTQQSLDGADRRKFWSAWWQDQQTVSWNERLSRKMLELEPTLDADEVKSLCLKILVEFLEKHPIPIRQTYRRPEEGMSTEALVSMRVSELLCEKTGLYETPWCFPIGAPDKTWCEIGYDTNRQSNWRARLTAEGYDLQRCE